MAESALRFSRGEALRHLQARRNPAPSDVIVHQHAGDTQHRSAAVVELDVKLVRAHFWIRVAHPYLCWH